MATRQPRTNGNRKRKRASLARPLSSSAVLDLSGRRCDCRSRPRASCANPVTHSAHGRTEPAGRRVLQVLIDDLRDRDRRLPLLVGARQPTAASGHERTRIGRAGTARRNRSAGSGHRSRSVRDTLPTASWPASGSLFDFEVDAGCEAIELVTARLRALELRDHGGKIAARLDRSGCGESPCRQRYRRCPGPVATWNW